MILKLAGLKRPDYIRLSQFLRRVQHHRRGKKVPQPGWRECQAVVAYIDALERRLIERCP